MLEPSNSWSWLPAFDVFSFLLQRQRTPAIEANRMHAAASPLFPCLRGSKLLGFSCSRSTLGPSDASQPQLAPASAPFDTSNLTQLPGATLAPWRPTCGCYFLLLLVLCLGVPCAASAHCVLHARPILDWTYFLTLSTATTTATCSNINALTPHMWLFAVDWLSTGRNVRCVHTRVIYY